MNRKKIPFPWEKWFDLRKEAIVGIDLGASSVKVAQLVRRGEKWVLVRLGSKEIPASENETLKTEARQAALKELLQGVDRQGTRFSVCLNSEGSAVRALTIPPKPERELKKAVALEFKNFFPFSTDDSLLEVAPSGEAPEKGLEKERVMAAVMSKKASGEVVALFKKLGLRPACLMPAACALYSLLAAQPGSREETRCVMDLGGRHTVFLILKGQALIFCREIPVAGRDFSQAMTGALYSERGKVQLTLEEAEVLKREVGLCAEEGELKWMSDKISSTQLYSMLRAPLELLVSEVDRCLEFYREATGGSRPAELVLFGRGTGLKGLPEALSRELGLEVKIGNPLQELQIEAQIVSPAEGLSGFACALGAALSRGKSTINLLPPEIKQETERALRRATLQSVVVGALLIVSFIYTGMRIQLANYQKRIAVAELELSSLKLDLTKAREKVIAHNLWADEPYWEDILREISNRVPATARLTEIRLEKRNLTLQGVIASQEKEAVLSDLIQSLEKGIFKQVKLVTAKETPDPSTSEFKIECGFD